ncbi:hypothetical protein HMPREF0518_1900 [Lactobacillus helveticus DSM 20075 = CGMCC 1.1877]|nr:hypothetical protein HMPREF0518_1900 [Lactobacillus helveticus DSM 20075 = CGMCC 1.1877]
MVKKYHSSINLYISLKLNKNMFKQIGSGWNHFLYISLKLNKNSWQS